MSLISLPFDEWMENVALAALSSKETVYASYDIARLAIERGVPGDFVECGVYGGAQCAAMARAIMDCASASRDDASAFKGGPQWIKHYDRGEGARRVHLFDSFAGIPPAGPEDREFLEAGHPEGLSLCTLEACKEHMAAWGIPDELLVWHPGPFGNTMNMQMFVRKIDSLTMKACPAEIAVLRLDADLYDSTRVSLENLYPLVSPGGWVICDDFDLSGARKAVMEHVGRNFGPLYWRKGQ